MQSRRRLNTSRGEVYEMYLCGGEGYEARLAVGEEDLEGVVFELVAAPVDLLEVAVRQLKEEQVLVADQAL